jgi:hypothetical protein
MNTLGKKSVVTSLGKKAKDVVMKGVKVASMVGLGGAALVGAAQMVSGGSDPNVRMVSSQSAGSRALFGTKR